MLFHYRYGHSPLLVLAFNFAHTGIGISALRFISGTGTVHYLHWHSNMVPVLVLAFLHFGLELGSQHGARTALRFSTGIGTVHYRNWHSKMVPVMVLAFWYFDSVSVLAWDITGTGIKNTVPIKGICPFLVWYQLQYHYWKITIIKLLTVI
jgi:hypothetical protein